MKSGMLLISNPNIVFRALPLVQAEAVNTIYIQYFPPVKWKSCLSPKYSADQSSRSAKWPAYSSIVVGLYSKVLGFNNLDVRVLLSGIKHNTFCKVVTTNHIDVVYYDQIFGTDEVYNYVGNWIQNKSSNCEIIQLQDQHQVIKCEEEIQTNESEIFDKVVLGGTFDRLHYGHKILLSESILYCKTKITVGVTDYHMLKGKKLWELIESCEHRIKKVKEFLEEVDPSLEYDVIPINDIYGPTKDDPTFQMIVVSSETVGGGSKINEIRLANGLNPLHVHQVELLADVNKEDEEEEEKISSSNLRLRSLGTLLRPPQPNANIAERPYIIGLTGGIASGKTNIAMYLAACGAGVIHCDQLAHDMYRVGLPAHAMVVDNFGQDILDSKGAIDRQKLGAIVFNDKAKLQKLNKLLWPLILEAALARVQQLFIEGHQVVVLEAAVLISAGWARSCHEVWVSIIPPKEAISRIMQRNGLTENEARARIESQPSNSEHVSQANVVFSTLWRPEFTKKQVTKAWTNLQDRLSQ